MSKKRTALSVAVCAGCGRVWTRAQMAARMHADPEALFRCDCEFEWNDAPFRPLTIQEILDGRRSLPCADLDLDAYTRSVVELVRLAGMQQ